jgi:subtilisin family serine protease
MPRALRGREHGRRNRTETRRALSLPLLLAGIAAIGPPAASAQTEAAAGEVIVRFGAGADSSERADARRSVGAELERTLPVSGLELLVLPEGRSVSGSVGRLQDSPDVAYAEPNFYRGSGATPNDPYFPDLWGLQSVGQPVHGGFGAPDADIDAPEAWDSTTGSANVIVAVVDSGIDQDHPDLRDNTWTNPGETGAGRESNGRDDDGNGRVDDWRGWDWVEGDNSPADANGHGTHVAGTIAARGNDGAGVAGVSWRTRLMALRVLGADGSGTVADIVSAYGYASRNGAAVVNASLGGSGLSRSEADAIAAARNTLFVVAAGNGGDDGVGDDNDAAPFYPCNHGASNLVCVAATGREDALARFSNFGTSSVDLAAPGTNVVSAQPGGSYAFYSGTSMATPHVAGAAALVLAARPGARPTEVRQALLDGAERRPTLAGKLATGARLNARGALDGSPPQSPPVPVPAPDTPSLPPVNVPAPNDAGPPPGSGDAPDGAPPVVSVAARAQRAGRVLRRGLRTTLRTSEPCRLTVQVRASARRGRAASLVGTRSLALGSAGAVRLRVRVRRAPVRRLARRRRGALVVLVRAVDQSGNRRAIAKRVRLSR